MQPSCNIVQETELMRKHKTELEKPSRCCLTLVNCICFLRGSYYRYLAIFVYCTMFLSRSHSNHSSQSRGQYEFFLSQHEKTEFGTSRYSHLVLKDHILKPCIKTYVPKTKRFVNFKEIIVNRLGNKMPSKNCHSSSNGVEFKKS